MKFFYHSTEHELICDGVSDLHCMRDAYLTEEWLEEYQEKNI